MFHQYAERQRKRESALHASRVANGSPAAAAAAAAATAGGPEAAANFEAAAREHATQSASALIRFLQVGAAFTFVMVLGSIASRNNSNGSGSSSPAAKRAAAAASASK